MNYVVSDTTLTSVADAIREKGGTSEELAFPQEWIEAIQNISTSSGKDIKKVSFTHTPATDETTFTFENPLFPNIPKVVVVDLDEENYEGEQVSMNVSTAFIMLPCFGCGENGNWNIYHEIIRYANGDGAKRGNCQTTASGNSPGYANGGKTIRVPGHNATACRYKADVPYIVSCYYWEDDVEEWQRPEGLYDVSQIASHKYGETLDNYTLNLDGITKLYPYAFYRCNMARVESDTLKIFNIAGNDTTQGDGGYVFANCTNLKSVYLPAFIYPGSVGHQFEGCMWLKDVYMPKLGAVAYYMFARCSRLVKIALPGLVSNSPMNNYGFYLDIRMEVCDLGPTTKTGTYEWWQCKKLNTLILRRTGDITQLTNINCFNETPFASGGAGGTLYVPQDLIDSYKSATNWSTILSYPNNQILPIEGSYYETHYGDDREIPAT